MIRLRTYFIFHAALLLCLLFSCCTAIDHHYRDFLENAEKIYPGRVDSVQFKPGFKRAAIRALISTDARVTKMRISWGQDHVFETDIAPSDIANYKEILIPEIEEGIYTFEIRTYDNQGNQSMRAEIFGQVYGPGYIANLNNRIINSVTRGSDEVITVNWFPESADSTLRGTLVTYMTLSGDSARVFTPGTENLTPLPNFQEETLVSYQTIYKPNSLAIDSFFSDAVRVNPMDFMQSQRELHSKATWTIAGFSSEEPNNQRLADRLIDDKIETFWIARFSSNPTDYPNHWISVDMQAELAVDGFVFAQKNGDRKIRELEVLVSNDNVTYTSLGLFGLAAIDRELQYVDLPETKNFRYFKLIPRAGHDAQKQPGLAEAGTFHYVK